jgi:TolA-binding protein
MSEELKPQDGLGLDGDEELMTDFADLFDDDEIDTSASEASPDDSDDNSLDELDAFLDDFERNLDIPDAGSGNDAATAITDDFDEVDDVAAENESPEHAASPEREIALDKAELDLDVGLDGEIFIDEVTLDEDEEEYGDEPESTPQVDEGDELLEVAQDDELLEFDAMLEEEEPAAAPGQADLALDTPPPAAVAATTAAAAAAVADSAPHHSPHSPHGAILPPPAGHALSRTQLIGGVIVLSLSLLLSLASLWMGLGLGAQIDVLNQNVSELQQRVLSQSRRGAIAPQAQLGEQLNRLGERVNELAVIVEGPVGHLRESTQQELLALGQRLDHLEQGMSVQPPPVVAVTSSKPLVSKAEPVMAAAATAKSGGWVINLLSVRSAGTANEELARLRKLGIRADQQTVTQQGQTWYRLRVTGFDSYAGAKAYIDTVEKQTGFRSAWVAKE